MALNDDDKKGALGTARALLGRVVGRVVGAALGTPPRPPAHDPVMSRAHSTVPASPRPLGVTPEASDTEPVVVVAQGANEVRISWVLSDEALARARRVLGAEGELRARVVVVAADERDVVAQRVEERADVAPRGDWTISDLPRGARCTAAVGVGLDERFVSAGHARVLSL